MKPPSVQTWPSVFTVADEKSATTSSSTLNSFAPPTAANGLALALQSSTRRVATFVSNVYPNLIIQPSQTWAVRNDRYKLVKSHRARCDADENPYEFYDLQPTPDNPVGLDAALNNLLNPPRDLTREQRQNLAELHVALNAILNSEPACYGDGNLDKVVNQEDFVGVHRFWNQPSVFDFNNDGVTDQEDLDCVLQNFGNDYLSSGPGESCP